MVWKFSGEGALKTAEHHMIHLKEYSEIEKVEVIEFGVEQQTEFSYFAYIVVKQELVVELRKKLKPHQGFFVE